MYTPETVEAATERYANNVVNYWLGLDWMRVAVPVVLDKKQAAKARQLAYKWLRENCPERFPKGYRFH